MYSQDGEPLDYTGLGDLSIARLIVTRIILIGLEKWISEYASFSRSSSREPVRNANYQTPPRPINADTLGVGSALVLCFNTSKLDSEGPASDQPSSFCGAGRQEHVWAKAEVFGAVDPGALGPLALPPPSTGQRQKEGSAPELGDSWLCGQGLWMLPPRLSPCNGLFGTEEAMFYWCPILLPQDSLEVSTGAEGLKRLTWHTLSRKHCELILTTRVLEKKKTIRWKQRRAAYNKDFG